MEERLVLGAGGVLGLKLLTDSFVMENSFDAVLGGNPTLKFGVRALFATAAILGLSSAIIGPEEVSNAARSLLDGPKNG